MERFDITGPVAQMPSELAMLGDEEIAPFVIRPLIGQPCVIDYTAVTVKRIYKEAIERHKMGKFNCIEVAFMLAEQQESLPFVFIERVADAYKNRMLRFYVPDGSPYPDYVEGVSDPYCRALNQYAYTTQDDVNNWLKQWGATYRLECYKPKIHGKKQVQQRELIIKTISELGYEPLALPPPPKGQRGVKAEVKDRIDGNEPFVAQSAFDTTWKELLKMNAIKRITAQSNK